MPTKKPPISKKAGGYNVHLVDGSSFHAEAWRAPNDEFGGKEFLMVSGQVQWFPAECIAGVTRTADA